jgi:hypothetical protein
MKDVVKLLLLERKLGKGKKFREALIFADEEAQGYFTSPGNWMAACLQGFGFETPIVPLSEGMRQKILEAQKRQSR